MESANYYGTTTINPISILLLGTCIIGTFIVKKEYVLIFLIVIANFISAAQRIVIAGMDFPFLRIMIMAIIFRAIIKNEIQPLSTKIDKTILFYLFCSTLVLSLRERTFSAFIGVFGLSLDYFGFYYSVKIYCTEHQHLKNILKTFAVISIIMFIFFIIENRTGKNFFYFLGGVPFNTWIRDGKLRCQGPYAHPILAGAFWVPIGSLFFFHRNVFLKEKKLLNFGIFCSIGIIFLSSSSTPLMSLIISIFFACLFIFRNKIKDITILFISVLLLIQLNMSNPIWFLIANLNPTGSSASYFRFLLIDKFISNWKEWIILGISDTYHWGEGMNLPSIGLRDIANQYVAEGVRGGLISLIAFLLIIKNSFSEISINIKRDYSNTTLQYFGWGLGISLISHMANFIGVFYFGEIIFVLWMLFALINNQKHIYNSSTIQ